MKCDFCGIELTAPYREYQTDDIETVAVAPDFVCTLLDSRGAWFACRDCAALIDADNWDALVGRTLDTHKNRDPKAWAEGVVLSPDYPDILRAALKTQYTVVRAEIERRKKRV